MGGLYKFASETDRERRTFRDFTAYGSYEPQDFVRIHETDLAALLRAAGRGSEVAQKRE